MHIVSIKSLVVYIHSYLILDALFNFVYCSYDFDLPFPCHSFIFQHLLFKDFIFSLIHSDSTMKTRQ
jgi:hypothetical protein